MKNRNYGIMANLDYEITRLLESWQHHGKRKSERLGIMTVKFKAA